MKCLGTLEVVGFQVPSRPPKPRFPATLARFGTVTPLKGKMGRTVPERSESQRCLPITDLSASICAKGIYRQVLFDPRAKARCLDHSEWATIRPRHGTRVPTTGAMIRIERPSGKVFQLDFLFRLEVRQQRFNLSEFDRVSLSRGFRAGYQVSLVARTRN